VRDLQPGEHHELLDALSGCVLVHDARTKEILWANRAACDLLGFTVEELRPLKATDMSGNARQYRREIGLRWLQRAVDDGTSVTEWCYRSKSGEEILTEAIATRVDLPSGPVVLVQFRDIAEEQAVRRDLQRTEGRMRAFLRTLDEGIVVVDERCRVRFASESAARLLQVEVSSLTGADFTRYCHTSSRAELRRTVADAGPRTPARHARYRMAGRDGAELWFHVSCQYLEVEDDLRGTLLLFHDISDRVHAEEEHRRDVQHLNHLARYNAMGDMAMAIAHDVGQPLAAAYNFVAGARGRLDSPQADREQILWGLGQAEAQIDRAREVLGSLRRYVTGLEESKQTVDFNAVLADCAHFLRLRARDRGVALTITQPDDTLMVHCEKVLIGQVMMNLAFNAIDEMARWPERERSVEVTVRAQPDTAAFEVRDRGRGLSGLLGETPFDGGLSTKSGGSGIGLALSHRIITRHGGEIDAAENDPRGAVFTFTLPYASTDGH
jgi:two-component system, LuxR family, sensor kinase FixL